MAAERIQYRCSDAIRWVKDARDVVLVDERQRKTFILRDAEAALWSWLSLGYSYTKLLPLIAALRVSSPAGAEIWLRATLGNWQREGILEVVEKEVHREH